MTDQKYREKGWLNQHNMAKSCGVSLSGFMKWGVEPVAKIGRCVFYSPGDVLANRLKHHAAMLEKKAASATGQDLLLRQEKLRLTNAMAKGQELKNARLLKQLIDVDLLTWTLDNVGSQIARHLGEIPAMIKKKCPRLTKSGTEVVRREISKAQAVAVQAGVNVDLDQFEAK